MNIRTIIKTTLLQAIFWGLCFSSCDSGNIYPSHVEDRNDNISIAANFVLSGDADTQNYQLYFAAFESGNISQKFKYEIQDILNVTFAPLVKAWIENGAKNE